MPRSLLLRRLHAVLLALLGALASDPRPAGAACNLIPGTAKTFNGTLGAINRPYAGPGERVEIRLRGCDTGSTGFLPAAGDQVVTLMFAAPDGTLDARGLAGTEVVPVYVGPDGHAWVTDGGLNAIVRAAADTEQVAVYRLPDERARANLNTAAFDGRGRLWFTGQSGIYGVLDTASGAMRV